MFNHAHWGLRYALGHVPIFVSLHRMWEALASIILRNRIAILIILALLTIFMGYKATEVKMTYKFGGILPEDDSTYLEYAKFLDEFGEDGNVMVIGTQGEEIFDLDNFAAWYTLGNDIKALDGVDSIFSIAHCYDLVKNETKEKLELISLTPKLPTSQAQVDSVQSKLQRLPFYTDLLYNDSTDATLMMVFVNAEKFNSEQRGDVMDQIMVLTEKYSAEHMNLAYSGLPHIRTYTAAQVKSELLKFVALAALVTAIILFIFFRSVRVVVFCLTGRRSRSYMVRGNHCYFGLPSFFAIRPYPAIDHRHRNSQLCIPSEQIP